MHDDREYGFVYLRRIAAGVVISTLIAAGVLLFRAEGLAAELLLYETIPYFDPGDELRQMFQFVSDTESTAANASGQNGDEYKIYTDGIDPNDPHSNNGAIRIEDTLTDVDAADVIGTGDVIYQDDSHTTDIENHFPAENITIDNLDKLQDITYLKNNFYIVDTKTEMTEDLFDADQFLARDLTIDQSTPGPKVLIFHTHASEAFSDSDINNPEEGIVGVGRRLKETLEGTYGLSVLHITERYDMVNGKTSILGAYERMEPNIEEILAENPSIELVIDLHRDGLPESSPKLLTEINGKPTAKIMFFNGLSKLKNDQGILYDIAELPNPNLSDNLALSFQAQLAANKLYPGFARKIYLKGYRFSLHMRPKSMLVEIGANTNTKEEAFNTAEPLADIIAAVVLKK